MGKDRHKENESPKTPLRGSLPELKGSRLELQRSMSEIRGSTTELRSSTPELQISTPELQGSSQDLQGFSPDLQRSLPDIQGSTPELLRSSPMQHRFMPNLHSESPEYEPSSPELKFRSDVLKSTPELHRSKLGSKVSSQESPELLRSMEEVDEASTAICGAIHEHETISPGFQTLMQELNDDVPKIVESSPKEEVSNSDQQGKHRQFSAKQLKPFSDDHEDMSEYSSDDQESFHRYKLPFTEKQKDYLDHKVNLSGHPRSFSESKVSVLVHKDASSDIKKPSIMQKKLLVDSKEIPLQGSVEKSPATWKKDQEDDLIYSDQEAPSNIPKVKLRHWTSKSDLQKSTSSSSSVNQEEPNPNDNEAISSNILRIPGDDYSSDDDKGIQLQKSQESAPKFLHLVLEHGKSTPAPQENSSDVHEGSLSDVPNTKLKQHEAIVGIKEESLSLEESRSHLPKPILKHQVLLADLQESRSLHQKTIFEDNEKMPSEFPKPILKHRGSFSDLCSSSQDRENMQDYPKSILKNRKYLLQRRGSLPDHHILMSGDYQRTSQVYPKSILKHQGSVSELHDSSVNQRGTYPDVPKSILKNRGYLSHRRGSLPDHRIFISETDETGEPEFPKSILKKRETSIDLHGSCSRNESSCDYPKSILKNRGYLGKRRGSLPDHRILISEEFQRSLSEFPKSILKKQGSLSELQDMRSPHKNTIQPFLEQPKSILKRHSSSTELGGPLSDHRISLSKNMIETPICIPLHNLSENQQAGSCYLKDAIGESSLGGSTIESFTLPSPGSQGSYTSSLSTISQSSDEVFGNKIDHMISDDPNDQVIVAPHRKIRRGSIDAAPHFDSKFRPRRASVSFGDVTTISEYVENQYRDSMRRRKSLPAGLDSGSCTLVDSEVLLHDKWFDNVILSAARDPLGPEIPRPRRRSFVKLVSAFPEWLANKHPFGSLSNLLGSRSDLDKEPVPEKRALSEILENARNDYLWSERESFIRRRSHILERTESLSALGAWADVENPTFT
ncbi:hypothetical protein SK128_026035, partial [Halocaridina rubra]